MDAQLVRTALGTLQSNPEAEQAWESLRSGLQETQGELEISEALVLLHAARERHAARGEAEAVEHLLRLSIELARGSSEELGLLREQARVSLEDLFDGRAALEVLSRALALSPNDAELQTSIEELTSKVARWSEQANTYLSEAEGATDDAYQSAMLMRAAEAESTFSPEPRWTSVVENLERAVRLDSGNLLAAKLLEVVLRRQSRFEDAARVLERVSERALDLEARVAFGIRLARLAQYRLGDEARAAAAYDRVLETAPNQADALEFVTDYYAQKERWDDLVRVYERQLKGATSDVSRLGDLLQVAMLHWKKRGAPNDAEPWFAKIRKIDPAHDGVLAFYREYKASLEDDAGLIQVLQEAQRALPEGDSRAVELATELARFADSQANAHRAIEQYKSVLRADPDNTEARVQLKSLYKQTQGHNALVELLRQDLERTEEEELEKRLEILREIASVYREYVKSETALVGVLNQIVQLDGKLDEHDVGEVRELVALYERLGRHRDLLASKKLLAEIVTDVEEKKALYRQIGRLWLDQFSNVQHAMEAFAALHEIDPADQEAIERLDELYRKRRAWKELYALYEEQLQSKQGQARVPLLRELAQLGAERLGKVEESLGLYREILEIDPGRLDVLDRMEKHAERAKIWSVLAEVLERRLAQLPEDETRLPVLQKLGAVYADHLEDAEQAIGTWRRVVIAQPGNPRAMRVLRDTYLKGERFDELEALYVDQNDLEGLAEVLSTAADRTSEPKIKLELSYRAARVYEEKLGQAARAIRSYERILSLDPRDAGAIERLLPLYEQEEKWARVPSLLETLVELADTPEEKVSVLVRLVEVTGQRLADKKGATAHARRAYEIAPLDPRSIELLDSASRAAGSWEEMVQALEARLSSFDSVAESVESSPVEAVSPIVEEPAPVTPGKKKRRGKKGGAPQPASVEVSEAKEEAVKVEIKDPEHRRIVLRLSRVLGEEQGQVQLAIEKLKALGAIYPNDEEILEEFEALLGREKRVEDVRWLFSHRVTYAEDSRQRAEVLDSWATYEEATVGDRAQAFTLYKQAVEEDPERISALEALARLALEQNEPEVAVSALERHRDLVSGVSRGVKEALLAELYAERLGRPVDALAAAERALLDGVESGRVLPVLARLVEIPEVRGDAARILSEQYEAGGQARQEADALRALISETTDLTEKVALYERQASVYEEKLGEPGGALGVLLQALREFPEQLSLWDRAESLARSSGRPTELSDAYREALRKELAQELVVDLCRRAAAHHEDVLGDPAGAVPYFEKLLVVEPDDESSFVRLKEILTAAERWRELEDLYDKEIQRREDEGRKIEMLAEVALLAEDIMGDAARALVYHQRILELDPVSLVSLESLDRLYTRLGKQRELVELLDRRVELAVGEEKTGYLVRIGQIALALHDPERSMAAIERVLEEDPTNYEARDVAESLLQIGNVRMRAARSLESVYEARDEIRDLVRVLGVRVEGLRPSDEAASDINPEKEEERRDLLRRIATLRNDRLHDDEGSFDVFAELAPLDPLDAELRDRLIDSGRRLGRSVRVVEVLLAAAESAETSALRGEILMQAARIQADLLEDQAAAEHTYARVVELREEEPDQALVAAQALELFFVSGSRHVELAANLKLQIELEPDFDRKRALLARLAHLSSDVLGDAAGAIRAWETRLDETSDDAEAQAALTELYEEAGRFTDLARVVEQRRDAAERDSDRLNLARKLAEIQELRLGETGLAIDSYQALLDESGPDPELLAALARLYSKAERYHELSEVYERQAEVLEQEKDRLSALAQLGQLRARELDDRSGALDAYRRALSLDSNQRESREALVELLRHEDTVTRLEAAEILQPIFEAEGNSERLLSVLEVQAQSSDDPSFQLERLALAVQTAEGPLSDAGRAMGYALRGTRIAASQGDIGSWLASLERLAPLAEARRAQVEILERIVPDLFDADQQLAVQKRVAELYRFELRDRQAAIASYKKSLELRSEDRESLIALEVLYEEAEAYGDLLTVLEQREELAEDEGERKQLLFRRASLLAEQLKEPSRAIETYESILDLELDQGAIASLERLYRAEERWEDLSQLIQRLLDEGAGDAVALRVKLARILIEHQREPERGLDEIEEALSRDSQDADAILLLEQLLEREGEPAFKGRAAGLLEPVYMVRANYDKVLEILELRRLGSEDPSERREFITRIAQIHEEQREDYAAALEASALLLAEDPEDEMTALEMERLAKVAGAELRLAELFAAQVDRSEIEDDSSASLSRRAGELFAAQGRPQKALPYLRRALAFSPESEDLFQRVDAALIAAGTASERVALYRQGLEQRFEPSDRLRLLHGIAELEERSLSHVDEAISAYREALEADESDAVALDALTRLYRQTEQWEELAELYQRRAEAASANEGAPYRLELASLYENELTRPESALDQLEEIVREIPGHAEAITRIEALRGSESLKERAVEILRPLYEAADDWKRLIKLNEDRFLLAGDPHEKAGILRETAELWESRGDAPGRARRVLAEAFKILPEDEELRSELERLVVVTGEWSALADLYAGVLEAHPDLSVKIELVARLAELYDERLDDPRAALDRFSELFELDPSHLEAVVAMERLSLLLADWSILEAAFVAHAELVFDDEDRLNVLVRLGALRQRILDDAAGATEAYERAFELDEQNTEVCDQLIALHEAGDNAGRLVELYQARVELTEEPEPRYQLLTRAAGLFEKKLSDRARAIEALSSALESRPFDAWVIGELNRLYREEEMWPELLDNLRLDASTAESQSHRLEVRHEIAQILAEKLESFDDALEAYGAILSENPEETKALDAVFALAEREEHLREQAASLLVPALRQTGLHERLVKALELRLSVESEPHARAETLRAIAAIEEGQLAAPENAFAALLRVVPETPEDASVHSEIERLAAQVNGWPRVSSVLGAQAAETFEPSVARDLWVRLAVVEERHLARKQEAIDAYQKATEQEGDLLELLEALDRLYTEVGDTAAVVELLDRRMALADSDAAQSKLLTRQGQLQLDEQKQPGEALASLRQALERDVHNEAASDLLSRLLEDEAYFDEAFDILESVYRDRPAGQKLAELHTRRVARASDPAERIDLRRALSRVLEEECQDPEAAQRVLFDALLDDPRDTGLQDEIERLLGITGAHSEAAAALLRAVDRVEDLEADSARELCVRAAGWLRDRAGDSAGAEAALNRALGFTPDQDEILEQLEALQSARGREADLLVTLERRSKLAFDDGSRIEFLRRAQKLAEALEKHDVAEKILRRILEIDEADLEALEALTYLRKAASDDAETFDLLVRRAEVELDGDKVRVLRFEAAELARDRLGRADESIELLEKLFDEDPDDVRAARALRQAYEQAERWEDLGRFIEREMDGAQDPAILLELKISLARLHRERFGDEGRAREFLEEVVGEDPLQSEAGALLIALYEESKSYEDWAQLLERQAEAWLNRGDQAQSLALTRQLAALYENSLGRRENAIVTWESIFEKDSSDDALLALLRLHGAEGDKHSAAKILEQLATRATGELAVTRRLELVELYRALEEEEKVLASLQAALSADPAYPGLRDRLRQAYEVAGSFNEVADLIAEDAANASSTTEKVAKFREAAAIHSKKRKDPARAAEYLSQASALVPEDRELLLELCDVLSESGRGAEAAEALQKVVDSYGGKRSKELAEIHSRLATAYLSLGNSAQALEELDKAFRIEPGNIAILKQLGEVALETGDLKKAMQMFRALLLQRLDDTTVITKAQVFLRLGQVHQALGETPKAKQMYERALSTDASLSEAQAALDSL